MTYDEIYLSEKIKDALTDEMTIFDEMHFEFDDCIVSVTGRAQQVLKYEYSSDHHLLSGWELVSRTADFDEVVISYENADDYLMTSQELYALEKMIDV
jgi:hypothetical protein